jgi:hypothetical protein
MEIIKFIIYGIIILLTMLVISFAMDNNTTFNKFTNKTIETFQDQRIRKIDEMKKTDIQAELDHNEDFKNTPTSLSNITKFKNPVKILNRAIEVISDGANKFAKRIKTTFKEEMSVKITKEKFQPNRYLVIFDVDTPETQQLLKENFYFLSIECNVDAKLMAFAQDKLDKMKWRCCELIYAIDADAVSEKIYICSEKTRDIHSMEKRGKNTNIRFYKAMKGFKKNHKQLLQDMLNVDAKYYIDNLIPDNWHNFTYQKRDDSGSVIGYNVILDDKYTVGSYRNNFIKLCKDIKCKKDVANNLKKWSSDFKNTQISWIAILRDGGFTIYVRK